ncbi:hypothetical protein LTS16_003908 [Friedmanniomyces endolithicus]|nr:hypothetical protein LTS16_003908 [Friedmanniomyces endolithicus]
MQPLQLFLALTPAFIATLAQSAAESALPQCAQEAFFAAIPPSGCQISDAHCICSNPSLLQAIHSAIQGACSPADQAAAAAFASSYCNISASSLRGSATAVATATETASTSTVANLPSSISAPASTSTPSGTLVVDTTALTTSTTSMMMSSGMMSSSAATTTTVNPTTSATSSVKPTNSSAASGMGNGVLGFGLAAFAVGVGAMSVAFADL